MIDVVDRIPTRAGRVKITHTNGTVEYVTLERADEPVEVGTPINKVLFDKINSDINQTGMVHQCAWSRSQQHFSPKTENLFPTSNWQQITQYLKYQNGNFIITASDSERNAGINMAFDNDIGTYWETYSGTPTHYATIDCGGNYKILEFKISIRMSTSSSRSYSIQGSFDGSNYVELATQSVSSTSIQNFTNIISNPNFYRYYRIQMSTGSGYTADFISIQATKYEMGANLLTADSFISNYYNGEQIYIKVPNEYDATTNGTYINLANLGEKEIVGKLIPNSTYSILYDGNQFKVLYEYGKKDFVVGSYSGNNGTKDVILDFTPTAVIVNKKTPGTQTINTGVAVTNSNVTVSSMMALEIMANGFRAGYANGNGFSNSNQVYNYVAFM